MPEPASLTLFGTALLIGALKLKRRPRRDAAEGRDVPERPRQQRALVANFMPRRRSSSPRW